MPLHQALANVASDVIYVKIKSGARQQKFQINTRAALILVRLIAPDSTRGWNLLHSLDQMDITGKLIPEVFAKFCKEDLEWFAAAIELQDQEMQKFVRGLTC